jgi:hypothetical protein
MRDEQRRLLKRVLEVSPEPYALTFEHPDTRALRDAGLIDLYDLAPNGDARWTLTAEGRAEVERS